MKIQKVAKKTLIIILIMIIGGLGGIIMDRYIFPYLSSTNFFSKYAFFKKTNENTTFINKTEQIYIKEDDSIIKLGGQISSSIVSVLSYPDPVNQKNLSTKIKEAEMSKGTGTIITSDGLIMVHASLITTQPGVLYKVVMQNGNSFDADLLGIDSYSQLAFLKINASNLPSISFSDSNEARSGQKIIALGSGYQGQFYRYSAGILSFINNLRNTSDQNLLSSEKMQGIFELDLNINDDYVGGPIVDYAGQVVGIIGRHSGENKTSFFGIPSNEVKKVIDKAINNELKESPVLGIYYVPLNKDYAIQNGITQESGDIIYSTSGQRGLAIISNSPADKAGLQLGDILTKINDQDINSENSLPEILYGLKKGDKIKLQIVRNNKEMDIEVSL